jgi:hypothetical protein
MIARKRLRLHIESEAQSDLDEMQDRDPAAFGFAIAAVRAALARPQAMERKGGKLIGHWSVAFPSAHGDAANSGRLVVRMEGHVLVLVAVDEDHDRAYSKARTRVKPKR